MTIKKYKNELTKRIWHQVVLVGLRGVSEARAVLGPGSEFVVPVGLKVFDDVCRDVTDEGEAASTRRVVPLALPLLTLLHQVPCEQRDVVTSCIYVIVLYYSTGI